MAADSADAAVLRAEQVCFRYSRRSSDVLRDFTVAQHGSVVGLLGPNGAGKTTLLSLVTGARRPGSGTLEVVGLDMATVTGRRTLQGGLGFVPQSMGIFAGYTVEQFLRYVCWLRRVEPAAQAKTIDDALRATDLVQRRAELVSTLSGGTRQRVKVAQALLNSPQVIVLDEPTAGLDPDQRSDFLDLVHGLRGTAPIILATHLVEDVARVCDAVLVLSDGQVAFTGTVQDLAGVPAGHVVNGPAVEAGYRRAVRAARVAAP